MRLRMSPWSFGTVTGRGSAAGATCRRGVGCGLGVTPASSDVLRLEQGEALVRVERPRLDEVALVGLATELLHGADERIPVQHLLLPGRLDVGERHLAPRLVVADAQRLVEPAVGL